jgi:uncharacterized protein (DUF305 family)
MNTIVILLIVFFICIIGFKVYEPFANPHSEYPCRVYLSDNDFLKHMITHHQMAIDISIQHIANTKNDIIMKILRELIWTQNYEILLMEVELNHKTENVSNITSNSAFIPTISSFIYPNVIGLTSAYCDPAFFSSNKHSQHDMKHIIVSDSQYIKHMIPHHQVAIDMCKIILKHTKSDFIIGLAYRMINEQESEIILLNDLLKSPFIK